MLYVNKSEGNPPEDALNRAKRVLERKGLPVNYDSARNEPSARQEIVPVLLDNLVDDQLGLCVYCARRIVGYDETTPMSDLFYTNDPPDRAHVEHYVPRHPGPWYHGSGKASADALSLEYDNLFAVCSGGRRNDKKGTTCDSVRGNRQLHVDPRRWSDIATISYTTGGTQFSGAGRECSDNEMIQQDIDDVLNLNHKRLCERRAVMQQKLYDLLDNCSEAEKDDWCRVILDDLRSGMRPHSFAPMLIWMLEERLGMPHTGMESPQPSTGE